MDLLLLVEIGLVVICETETENLVSLGCRFWYSQNAYAQVLHCTLPLITKAESIPCLIGVGYEVYTVAPIGKLSPVLTREKA